MKRSDSNQDTNRGVVLDGSGGNSPRLERKRISSF